MIIAYLLDITTILAKENILHWSLKFVYNYKNIAPANGTLSGLICAFTLLHLFKLHHDSC